MQLQLNRDPVLAFFRQKAGSRGLLGGSWYLLTNYNCTYSCTYNHIRALQGPVSGL